MKIKLQLVDDEGNVLISSTVNQDTVETVKKLHDVNLLTDIYESLKEDLKNFLIEGWDQTTNQINIENDLDVDSLCLLHIIKNVNPGFLESNSTLNLTKPILKKQAELFCDDVRRLLVYKRLIPRNVLIDYLKTITSFHLSLYIQKLVHFLPKMIETGKIDIDDNWSIVLDATDNFESKISHLAINDAEEAAKKAIADKLAKCENP